ncbi:MAG: DUF6569 family protein [Isosphaeraceae bacterium]
MGPTLQFPTIRIGDPLRHDALTVFPLLAAQIAEAGVDSLLSDEAVATGSVTVEEVSESGSVPTLLVTNRSQRRVLFLEGEELRGAKQNRVLNTSVLIAAGARTTIPVSCVEQGRWRFRSRQFSPSQTSSSSKLRRRLKESVSRSLREGQGHRSDQGAVWSEVTRQMTSLGSSSETMAMADTYESYRPRLEEFRKNLSYPAGATGLAVAIGPDVVALDVFDKPATCQKVWDRLLSGFVMDALEARPGQGQAGHADIERFLERLNRATWQESPPVGEGREFRAEADPQTHASALVFEASLLHGSAVADAPTA